MSTFAEIIVALVEVGCNYLEKDANERANRNYAKSMGWKEDGIAVDIMNWTSKRKREKAGYRF